MENAFIITTPFGPAEIRAHALTKVSIGNPHGASLTVNTVPYHLRLGLENYGSGFELQRNENGTTYHALYMSREGASYRDTYPSSSARNKIISALPVLVNAWAKTPEALAALHAAEVEKRSTSVSCIAADIAEAEGKLEVLRGRLAEASQALDTAERDAYGFTEEKVAHSVAEAA